MAPRKPAVPKKAAKKPAKPALKKVAKPPVKKVVKPAALAGAAPVAVAKAVKVPKTVKLPWHHGAGLVASEDGTVAIAAGESGSVARLDLAAWKAVAWPRASGFVNSLAISPDNTQVAVAVTGADRQKPHIELRSTVDGAVLRTLQTAAPGFGAGNARVSWSPSGARLLAVLEGHVGHESVHLALIDPATAKVQHIDLGDPTSVAAAFVDEQRVLVFADRGDPRSTRVAEVDVGSGAVTTLPAPTVSVPARLLRRGPGELVIAPLWDAWQVVDAKGVASAEGCRGQAVTLFPHGVLSASGPRVTVTTLPGGAAKVVTAKKRAEALAFAGGQLLILESGQVEVVAL
jgi:hypothetical protein